jgi:hypothetical protein
MKKIAMLSFGVVFSTMMFAGVGNENPNAVSTISVKKEGENTYNLKYKAVKAMDVSISIVNEDGESIYMETIKNTNGFIRPYNFFELDKGVYTIEIADQAGVHKELVDFGQAKVINILKLSGEDRYLVSASGEGKEVIVVNIYDGLDNLIRRDIASTDGNFGQKYKLDNINGPVKFEVTSENGAIKTAKY